MPRLGCVCMARLRKTCPRCKSRNVATILYGYRVIDDELEKELKEGRTVLGGCVVRGDGSDPRQMCHDCENEWGRTGRYY